MLCETYSLLAGSWMFYQGSQHFKKTKFPDEVSKFHDNNFNSFPVSHVFYVDAVNYLQCKTLM